MSTMVAVFMCSVKLKDKIQVKTITVYNHDGKSITGICWLTHSCKTDFNSFTDIDKLDNQDTSSR